MALTRPMKPSPEQFAMCYPWRTWGEMFWSVVRRHVRAPSRLAPAPASASTRSRATDTPLAPRWCLQTRAAASSRNLIGDSRAVAVDEVRCAFMHPHACMHAHRACHDRNQGPESNRSNMNCMVEVACRFGPVIRVGSLGPLTTLRVMARWDP